MILKTCIVYFFLFVMLVVTVAPVTGAAIPIAGEWTGWTSVGDTQASGNPAYQYGAPAVVSREPGMIELFSLDTTNSLDPGSQLKMKEYLASSWLSTDFYPFSGPLNAGTNPIGVASTNYGNRMDFWASGPYNRLFWTKYEYPAGWNAEWVLPAGEKFYLHGETGPTVWWNYASTHEYVFWVNATDQHLILFEWANGGGPLSGWEYPVDLGAPPGLTLTSSPSVCLDHYTDELYIFVRASNHKLWYNEFYEPPGVWEQIPGSSDLRGAPSAVSRDAKNNNVESRTIDVFYMTTGGNLVMRQINTWPFSISGEIVIDNFAGDSDPAAVALYPNRLDVFTQHVDGEIFQNTWISPGSTIGVFRPSARQFILNTDPFTRITYGLTTDTPITGDWNCDGKSEIGVFRTVGSQGQFILDTDNDGIAESRINFGMGTDTPITGDWDNDNYDEIGVFRAGQFILDNNNCDTPGTRTGVVSARINFGIGTDKPVTGDWDKDGYDEIGVFRSGQFILDNTNYNTAGTKTGVVSARVNFGIGTDKPVTGNWDNDNYDEIGVFRAVGSQGQFILDNTNYNTAGTWTGIANARINFGIGTDKPVTGKWYGGI